MLNILFSQLTLTKRSLTPPDKVITVTSEKDLQYITDGVARYEYPRGKEGKIIVDLTKLRGVEDLGNKVKVLAGTPWKDVIKYNPEIFGNLHFSVGGSVEYGDAGFGFNEFRFIKDRVEVEAYLDGMKYTGKYKGGIIYAVYVKKEFRNLVTKVMESDDFDVIYYLLERWIERGLPPFRDITIVWKDKKFSLNVTYPQTREELVKNYLDNFADGKLIYEDLSFPHKYKYFGVISLAELPLISNKIIESTAAFIRVSFKRVYFSIYSDTFLGITNATLSPFSDVVESNNLNGCTMCGECVNVCPYVEYKNSPIFSPLGYYVLKGLGSLVQINCHMCGKCVDVCPAHLNIINDISKDATYHIVIPKKGKKLREIKGKRVIVITPISESLLDRLAKTILYLYSKGIIVGLKYINVNAENLIKGIIDWNAIASELSGVSYILTITPEEYYYLQPLKSYMTTEIEYIENLTLNDVTIDKTKIHIPCFLRNIEKKYTSEQCSFAFLDLINNTTTANTKINAQATLCPFASKKLNIPTTLDLLIPVINLSNLDLLEEKIKNSLKNFSTLLEDASWYKGVADELYDQLEKNMLIPALAQVPKEALILLYITLDENKFTDFEKKLLEEKLLQLLSK